MFAIIDTETSGGKYNEEKIIEIGILVYDGNKIIETFQSLINPQKKVDYFVQKLTGIKEKELKRSWSLLEMEWPSVGRFNVHYIRIL